MAKIGIIYATGSKMIRRIVVPDNEADLQKTGWVKNGETLLIADGFPERGDIRDPANNAHVRDKIIEATGVTPPTLVCAVVNAGVVEAMIVADPAVDTLPGKTLIKSYAAGIDVGCTYDARAGLFTRPAYTVPAHTDRDGNPVPEQTVPATVIPRP